MASVASLKWLRLAKLKGVSRSVCRLHFSTDVTKRERFVDKMKKFVFGEGAPPEQNEEAVDRSDSTALAVELSLDISLPLQLSCFNSSCSLVVVV